MASAIDLDRVRRNDDRLSTLQLILSASTAVNLPALKEVLRVNTKVSEVIIYVDEHFLVELPVEETHDLFRTIGGMPNLQKLGFHSQSGSNGVLSVQALVAITSRAARMVHFGISDVALWGTRADFQEWATELQSQLFLQSFCVCECELLDPEPTTTTTTTTNDGKEDRPLDSLLTVLSILPSLQALFLQAATPLALGHVSPQAVGAIGMAPQLLDLRLGNFELQHSHLEQLASLLIHKKKHYHTDGTTTTSTISSTVMTELKLDACQEFDLKTASAIAQILKHNTSLKSIELGFHSMMPDDCAVVIANSLTHNPSLQSFTLSRSNVARFRPTITPTCQQAFVQMLQHNYALETLVLFQRFPVKREFKLFLTLNKYGRGKLLRNHDSTRGQWISAIHKVHDDLDSIFYYLSINPNLCSPEFTNQEDDTTTRMAAAARISTAAWDLCHGPSDQLVAQLAGTTSQNNLLLAAAAAAAATASSSSGSSNYVAGVAGVAAASTTAQRRRTSSRNSGCSSNSDKRKANNNNNNNRSSSSSAAAASPPRAKRSRGT